MERKRLPLDERIKNIKGIYGKLDELCNIVPEPYASKIRNTVANDQELKELLNQIDKYRAPRILLIGRTGFGKSTLINALVGKYVAEVSDVKSCTTGTTKYVYDVNEGAKLEILDTRGISESLPIDEGKSAEKQIMDDVLSFDPDVTLFVLSCTSRDGIDDDVNFIQKIRKACYQKNAVELPVIVAINKADAVTPSREPVPFSDAKLKNIGEIRENIQSIFKSMGFNANSVLTVASCIDWIDSSGKEYKTASQLNNLTKEERNRLKISFDARYHIDELRDELESSVSNVEANMGMKLVFHLNAILTKTANNLINIFCGISSIIAAAPLPVADYFVLLTVEALLVSMIMALSGREMSLDAGKEFIGALAGTAGVGLAFKQVATLLVKYIPGAGPVISAGVAASGVKLIGNSAIEYFINEKDMETVKREFQKNSRIQKLKAKVNQAKNFVLDRFAKKR